MNRITAYQNASAIMSFLIGTGVGTIISLDVYPLSVELHIHLPWEIFKVADVRKMIKPYVIGRPKFSTTKFDDLRVEVLNIEWDDFK